MDSSDVFGPWIVTRLSGLVRNPTHLYDNGRLRALLQTNLPVARIEDMAVPFECVAACVERAAAHWFRSGPLVPAVLASCAVPGLLPPVAVDGEHFLDGGLVDSLPIGRAIALGATQIYVLHVGRLEQPLQVPRWPWDVATTAFEIARRSRFTDAMADLPAEVKVHVLPTGSTPTPIANLRFRSSRGVTERIERARAASLAQLRGG
jgi:NTE family protein